jgi:GNAT superfamily N-acetyltransferase
VTGSARPDAARGDALEVRVRAAVAAEFQAIPTIHLESRKLFIEAGRPEVEHMKVVDQALIERAAGQDGLLVAEVAGEVVGFALCERFADIAHLHQMSVLPQHTGVGLGSRLLEELAARCTHRGDHTMTLITYIDVPWNRPFYRRHSFEDTDPTPHLTTLLRVEAERGVDVRRRVAMSRTLCINPGRH